MYAVTSRFDRPMDFPALFLLYHSLLIRVALFIIYCSPSACSRWPRLLIYIIIWCGLLTKIFNSPSLSFSFRVERTYMYPTTINNIQELYIYILSLRVVQYRYIISRLSGSRGYFALADHQPVCGFVTQRK